MSSTDKPDSSVWGIHLEHTYRNSKGKSITDHWRVLILFPCGTKRTTVKDWADAEYRKFKFRKTRVLGSRI